MIENFDESLIFYEKALALVPVETKKQLQNEAAYCIQKNGIKLSKQKKYAEALMQFDKSISKCTEDFPEIYSLLWWKSQYD